MHYRIKQTKLKTRRKLRYFEQRYRNHRYALPIVAFVAIAAIGVLLTLTLRDSNVILRSQVDDSNIVILHVDRDTKVLPTREKTVEGLLKNANVQINDGDVVEPALDTKIEDDDFRINVYRAAPVVIQDDDAVIVTKSAAQTSRSIADQAGLEVYPEDDIVTEPSRSFLKDGIGSKVVINRSVPVVLNLYGTSIPVRTQASTVGELLAEKSVSMEGSDSVMPTADTPLEEGVQVFVTRFGVQVVTSEESIPMTVETVEDSSLSFGTSAVRQVGSDGKKSVTYQINMENGVEVGRTLIQEVVVQEPVNQIVAKGKAVSIPTDKTAVMNAAGIASKDHAFVNHIVTRESRWNITARNTSSGAYGLCQALPGNKMASAGSDWETNPITQLKWCSGYALGRYGSWEAAYNFWVNNHWW